MIDTDPQACARIDDAIRAANREMYPYNPESPAEADPDMGDDFAPAPPRARSPLDELADDLGT